MFENLKKHGIKKKSLDRVDDIYFMLYFDENGAYVEVTDKEKKKVENLDSSSFDRDTKEILKNIENITESSLFVISWSDTNDRIYLNEHPYLFELLKKSRYFVNENFEKIELEEGIKQLSLSIETLEEKEANSIRSTLLLDYTVDNFRFITEDCVVSDNKLYRIKSIGENYLNTGELNSSFGEGELEKFLTISYSYFDNLDIDYRGYGIVFEGQRELKPEIIIEKIARDRTLYLKLGLSISSIDYDFLEEYDARSAVLVNDLEKKIIVCDVDISAIGNAVEEIVRILVKYQRKLKLREAYYLDGNLIIMQENLAKEFVTNELLNLIGRYKVLGTDKLKKYKIKTAKPRMVANLSHSIDFLEGDAYLDIDGEKFSIFDFISNFKENSYIVLSDGTNALVSKKYIEKLERIFKKKDGKLRVSFFDLPIVEELIEDKIGAATIVKDKGVFLGFNQLKDMDIPVPKINASLREYQDYGYRWFVYLLENRLGGCLADDMGLGKTLQAISLLSYIYSKPGGKPSLVAMPKSLIYNWENEIKRFNSDLSVSIYYGINRNIEEAMKSNVILTTYGTVRNDIKDLRKKQFELVILDESQNIKNINSQTTKAVMLLNSNNRFALSGTPVENNLGELYSLFRFINPNMFGSIEEFNYSYANPIQRDNDREVVQELRKKIYPFILRRTKKEVLKDLPEKIEKVMYIEMNPEQKKIYEERRLFYYKLVNDQIKEHGIGKSQFFILQALNELR